MCHNNKNPHNLFLRACQNGDLEKLKSIVTEYDVRDWTVIRHKAYGDTGLHVAAREGHLNVVIYLCETWDEPDFKIEVANKDSKRPLHEAAQFSHPEVLKYLISKGAVIDSLKRADWTPLMLACTRKGNNARECVKLLLKANANLNLINKDGWNPLLIACRHGDSGIFNLLVEKSSECINRVSKNGRSSLHVAAFHGNLTIIESLISMNSGLLNARDSSGCTPLHEAVKYGNLDIIRRLIELGADAKAIDSFGQTILHVAATAGNEEAIDFILTEGIIDVHSKSSLNITPLMMAQRNKESTVVEILLKHGACH